MKFSTYFALVASASALKLSQMSAPKSISHFLKDDKCPSQEMFSEIASWVHNELTTGDKTITADEAEAGAIAFAKKHGIEVTKEMEEQAVAAFESVDKDDNGELDLAEMEAAWKKHGGDKMMKHCGLKWPEGTFLATKNKFTYTLTKEGECPTQEQFDQIASWVHHELSTGDKTITAAEAEAGALAFAKAHGIEVTDEMKKAAVEAFESVDTDDNGELDLAEMEAAWKKHEGDKMMKHCKLKFPEGTF